MVSQDAKVGDFYVNGLKRPSSVVFYLCMCLRIMFSYNAAAHGALLLHASVISHNSASTLFLGASGTGKSTHSRLWLDHIAGAELVNDDNPVVRLEDGHWSVYGTPWSGKTPCYRNVKEPVRAFVRLSQAPENHIERVKGIAAYAAFVGSVSTVRWDKSVMDSMTALASDIAQNVPTYKMGCLPNAEAAEICCSEVEKQ